MKFATFKQATRIEQALFGLPFLFSGVLLPFIMGLLPFHAQLSWLWILPAFFAARISGMLFNQVIDHKIDKENPRTKNRVIPAGVLASQTAWMMAFISLFFFLFCSSQINLSTFYFALLASLLLLAYSYTKRISALCHLVLGAIHFLGPFMAWVALVGKSAWPPFFLSGAAMSLIVGTDIIYGLQDVPFDTAKGLHSMGVYWGYSKARIVACGSHLLTIAFLFCLGVSAMLSWSYYLLLPCVALLFLFFHSKIAKRNDFQGIEPLFFYCTSGVALMTFIFLLSELFL